MHVHMYVHMCVCYYVGLCECAGARGGHQVSLLNHSPFAYFSETVFRTEPGAYSFEEVGLPVSSGDLPVSATTVLGI